MAITVNGRAYSHVSVRLQADGLDIEDLDAIEYANSVDRGEQRGTAPGVKRRTRGQGKAEAKLTFSELRAYYAFIARFGAGYLEKMFTIVVSYAEGPLDPVFTDTIVDAQLKKPARKSSQGTDAQKVECDLDCNRILENGLEPFEV
jgi:hypothetical protein